MSNEKHMYGAFVDNKGYTIKSGMTVPVKGNDINRAMRQLKRKRVQEGFFKELKKTEYYEKPTWKRKRKWREALRRQRKKKTMDDNV